jgi:hypothetical protein
MLRFFACLPVAGSLSACAKRRARRIAFPVLKVVLEQLRFLN